MNVLADIAPAGRPGGEGAPLEIRAPHAQDVPFVFASPHSGRDYPAEFLAASRLDPLTLRRSEDCYVDELVAGATALGAPLLLARFPRAFCDANRDPAELDPAVFAEAPPATPHTRSPRVHAGLGVIARVVRDGKVQTVTEKVIVKAGQETKVSFTLPEAGGVATASATK